MYLGFERRGWDEVAEPATVFRARQNAEQAGFGLSSEEATGRLLAVLAAAVPAGGSVLELGTGLGVGTAWLVAGLSGRDDVRVLTVDLDEATSALAQDNDWPGWVEFRLGDAVELLPTLGTFDLIFADAQGGKWFGLDLTIAALGSGGMLVVDDMASLATWSDEQHRHQDRVRHVLLDHPDLVACQMDYSTGLIMAARRRL